MSDDTVMMPGPGDDCPGDERTASPLPCSQPRSRRRSREDDDESRSCRRAVLRLRVPISLPPSGILPTCSYARISRDEQRRHSIKAQHTFTHYNLKATGLKPDSISWDKLEDKGISGEVRDRPGIDELRAGIESHRWGLIMAEDSSRIYRDPQFAMELFRAAVDEGIRIICINDGIDTAEDDWEERLREAQEHHCKSNKFTRTRCKRTMEELWDDGAAVTHLHSGYLRIPSVPATKYDPPEGPFYDEIDPKWISTIRDLYDRFHRRECPHSTLTWLQQSGLPGVNNRPCVWTMKMMYALIQCTIYKGVEERGKSKTIKKRSKGKSKQVRTAKMKADRRKMPHLRLVSDHIWESANAAISEANSRTDYPIGADHTLFGIPRNSRFPLSHLFICGICGKKMYGEGRNEGAYRCSRCRKHGRTDDGQLCWNKATCLRSLTHENIARAVYDKIASSNDIVDKLVASARADLADDSQWNSIEAQAVSKVRQLDQACKNLLQMIERLTGRADEDAMEDLTNQWATRNAELSREKGELEQLRESRRAPNRLPSAEVIRETLQQTATHILDLDIGAAPLLERLIDGKIVACPYQQFDSNKVVLRAEFTLRLVNILPTQLLNLLSGKEDWKPDEWLPPTQMVVNLFPPSEVPANAMKAFELKSNNNDLTLLEIGAELGIGKRNAHLALQMGKKMAAASVTDPYIRLTQGLANPSRWRANAKRYIKGSTHEQ